MMKTRTDPSQSARVIWVLRRKTSSPAGGFGAVLAHAGVGKTALLVQLALNSMLRSRNVLHVSLNDPVNKVNLWYSELFHHLAGQL